MASARRFPRLLTRMSTWGNCAMSWRAPVSVAEIRRDSVRGAAALDRGADPALPFARSR